MKKLSIVVPVYNCKDYLKNTIESLLNQNYKNAEIILVDDGSNDGSDIICKEYSDKNDNIIYIRQRNAGPGAARNAGIDIAVGEYIAFCDSDDAVDVEMYSKMIAALEENQADITLCDFYSERNNRAFGLPWDTGKILTASEIRDEMIPLMVGNETDDSDDTTLWGSSVRCIFKKDILNENTILFPSDISFAEDLIFVLRYLSVCQKAVIVNEVLYLYRFNSNSLMTSQVRYVTDMFHKRMKVINYVGKILKNLGIYEKNATRLHATGRCYVYECLGNACRHIKRRSLSVAYEELQSIIRAKETKNIFRDADAKYGKKKILNYCVKHKMAMPILFYYVLRFRLN